MRAGLVDGGTDGVRSEFAVPREEGLQRGREGRVSLGQARQGRGSLRGTGGAQRERTAGRTNGLKEKDSGRAREEGT